MEVTNEGIQIVEELLRTWTSRTSTEDNGDVLMHDDLSPDTQLAELRRCVHDLEPRIACNQWLQTMLASLWPALLAVQTLM
jgi:DNA mismatch repair protein MSH2